MLQWSTEKEEEAEENFTINAQIASIALNNGRRKETKRKVIESDEIENLARNDNEKQKR